MAWRPAQRSSKPKPKPAMISAAIAMMAAERADRPFGGFAGEIARPQPSAPPRPAPQPFVIPPWPEEERRAAMQAKPEPPPKPLGSALAELKAREGEEPPPMRLEPPETVEPLLPVRLPEPDWRAEQKEQARRDRKPRPIGEPDKSLQRRPA